MSKLLPRIITGLVFLGLVIVSVSINPWIFAALFGFFTVIGIIEFYKMSGMLGFTPQKVTGIVIGVLTFIVLFLLAMKILPPVMVFLLPVLMLSIPIIELFRQKPTPTSDWAHFRYGRVLRWLAHRQAQADTQNLAQKDHRGLARRHRVHIACIDTRVPLRRSVHAVPMADYQPRDRDIRHIRRPRGIYGEAQRRSQGFGQDAPRTRRSFGQVRQHTARRAAGMAYNCFDYTQVNIGLQL